MKKYLIILILLVSIFCLISCEKHTHDYIEGICTCGATDPSYVAPHIHEYIDCFCSCGKLDPSHEHKYLNGYCSCGEKHPNFGNCALDRDNELCLDSATWSWDYNKNNWDGKGITIEIMVLPVSDYDPYNQHYKGERKEEKQALINKLEAEYNIDIVFKDYPYDAPWGPNRINWLINGYNRGMDIGDIFLIDASWIYQLQQNKVIAELYDMNTKTGIFAEYNYVQDEIYNTMSSQNNKVYAYTNEDLIPDFWLYYNQNLIDKYDLPDPATLWNNNEWTWSTFLDLLEKAQNAFDNDLEGITRWAFGGDYFTNALGFVAVRGGQFVKNEKVLLDEEIVVEVYEDLQDIEDLYWEKDGSTVSTTNFRDGLVLFQTGAMWFYGAAERWPTYLDFSISAVPYPRGDDDPELKNYQIPVGYENMFTVRNVKEENGLTSSILFNILDDYMSGLKPVDSATQLLKPVKVEDKYRAYLEARIENKESVKAIMDIVFNHKDLIYLEMIDLISMLVNDHSYYSENGIYGKSTYIIQNEDVDVERVLKNLKGIYQTKLDELLGKLAK